MNIGNKIKDLRKSNKMTQLELAAKSNISRSYLADIERNRYNASLDTLKAIATALNVNLNEFFDSKETTNSEKTTEYFLEQYLRTLGYEFIYDSEGYVILDYLSSQYEISESDITDIQKSVKSFIKFKLLELMDKSKKISKTNINMPMAAHNDFADDDEQQKLMKQDLDEL